MGPGDRVVATAGMLLLVGLLAFASQASAAEAPVGLGTASTYSVLGAQTVTNTGPTTIEGDLGVSPGSAVTGFPPGIVLGTVHAADASAAQAQVDLTAAYSDAAGRTATGTGSGDIGGQTLSPGVYNASSSLGVTGTLTLDAGGDPDAVFIFQIGSTLTTASSSVVSLIGEAQACNVFWQIGSSATLGTNSTFGGTMLASTSITVTTGTLVQGRALARNGSVTLDSDTVISGACTAPPVPTTTTSVTATASVTSTVTQAGAASTAPFVPGAGLTGDTSPGNASPLKAILLGVTATVLGSAAVIVRRRRPRGKRA
jgi:Ice-binding-like